MIAMTILTIAVMSLLSLVGASLRLEIVNRETSLAVQAASRAAEEIRALPFAAVFATCNADPADDPEGAGTARGSTFAVEGLIAPSGGGAVGEIVFPLVGAQLREDVANDTLGTPLDLDLDGTIDNQDHAGDYLLVPVAVRIRWAGKAGDSRYEIATLLRGDR